MISRRQTLIAALGLLSVGAAVAFYIYQNSLSDSNDDIQRWFREPASRPGLITIAGEPCSGAPFLLPSSGLIGLLWRDTARPYHLFRRHSGIDIFGDGAPGEVPVVAAYDGYLTRLDSWFSTVIIRHDDPLHPGETIWTYYTHMADRDGRQSFISAAFPPGSSEVFVRQGTLLGYQGEYAGTGPAVGLHLHMSIVKSDDEGSFLNEAVLDNTLDPSPYFGLSLNIDRNPEKPIRCS